MKRFTALCKDKTTGYEMVLSECSFNQACSFLESKRSELGKYLGTFFVSINVSKLKFEKATFLYDEERGLLMKM